MNKNSPYWVNNVYGLGYWLKDYGYYPRSWPLYNYIDHGMSFFDRIPDHEIENDAAIIFKFSSRLVQEYKKVSNKPVYALLNPTVHCRNVKQIERRADATGTLFFPGHSTDEVDDETHWDSFIRNMENIPKHFLPVDICLHPTDIKKGLAGIFEAKGYRVFSAGDAYSESFAENFYEILSRHRYAMSNLLGSYVFYSIEMGIPFSLFGPEPNYVNKGDKNIEKGVYTSYKQQTTYQKAYRLFAGFHEQISEDQLNFVRSELGMTHSISRMRTASLLYKAFFFYSFWPRMKAKIKTLIFKIPGVPSVVQRLKYRISGAVKKDEDYLLVERGFVTSKEIFRLKSTYQNTSTLLGKPVLTTDSFWYLHSLREIFAEEVYKFRSQSPEPRILDCGSNIGLSVIYFKYLYPKSRITAFEPDKKIFNILKNNLEVFGCPDVEIRENAIWVEDTQLNFSASGDLGGKIDETHTTIQNDKIIQVQAVRLKNYLSEKIDFLKLDIEGPEVEVLMDCRPLLHNVQNLFVEYHSDPKTEQKLDELLEVLRTSGFRTYIKEAWNNLPHPFLRKDYQPFYDMQLNIFAYRD